MKKRDEHLKKVKPIKVFPIRAGRLAGLGKIVEKHMEHTVSEQTWRAMGNIKKGGGRLGWCAQDGEALVKRFSFGQGDRGPVRGAAAQAELKALGAAMLKEVNELRGKGVEGKVPLCLTPSKIVEPGLKFYPEDVVIHERFHAQNGSRRAREGVGYGTDGYNDRVACESAVGIASIANLVGIDKNEVSTSIPTYWTGGFTNWWAVPEEAFARAEPLRVFCHEKKDAEACRELTAMYHNDIKVNSSMGRHPNLIRELADAMQKQRTNAKAVFDELGNICPVGERKKARPTSYLPPLKPLEPKKKEASPKPSKPKKVAKPAKPVKVLKPKKARKTVAKRPVKKAPKKTTVKKPVRATAKVSGKRVKLVCSCKSV